MKINLKKTGMMFAVIGASLITTAVMAGGTHSHGHDDQGLSGQSNQDINKPLNEPGHSDSNGHQHDSWEEPPAGYAAIMYDGWGDGVIANRGKQIYQEQCVSCHGASGKGNGPVAKGLEHPPADLTNHFHKAPGQGDGYLYWRISEGGNVEPFRTMKSAMPSFKTVLSEEQRWEVLTYIHQSFHGGFSQAMPQSDMKMNEGDQHHDPAHKH